MSNRASFPRRVWITLRTGLSTAYYSLCAIVGASMKPESQRRAYIDGVCRRWSAALLRHVRLKYRIHGQDKLHLQPGKSYIVMTNHSSHYDIPVSFMALPGSMRMLAKKELYRIPLFGTAMRHAEFLQVDRQNQEQARRDLEAARLKMESGIMLWVAPEGTRSRTGELLPFKKGGFHLAINTGAIIIPVGIRGIDAVLPTDGSIYLNQEVDVHIGEGIDASTYTLDRRQELVERVRAAIQELSGRGVGKPREQRLAS